MPADCKYEEQLTSQKTTALFVILTMLFTTLFVWRAATSGLGFLTIVLLVLSSFFLFYSLNYRVLTIRLTASSLTLSFGLITRRIATSTIDRCYLDDVPMWRIGGAGIHFTTIRKRYRAMFNFLEYSRVVIALKEKKGPVWDVAFSTRQPEEIMRLINEVVSEKHSS